ncbi:MAG: acetyl-CoA carboxylase carboxyltransferase subunit alpha [Rhabdochlamydiaceae bacterium]|nr:acetyl-CoA carboxylase carboxyltransferase subunit alpha [Candidatus Amphrikana amoebophyrae]
MEKIEVKKMGHTLNHEKQIQDFEDTLDKLKIHQKDVATPDKQEVALLEKKLMDLKKKVYSALTPWERVAISRHPNRPHSLDYIKMICSSFEEVYGDRLYRDDSAIIGGLGIIGGEKFIIIAQEKGHDTESRLRRNFGMPHPEGYRKAQRLMKMAEKFNLPVLCLVDTPGAHPGLEAEERGQGRAIADNLFVMARLKTPIIVAIIGEGCSGGALGIGIGDRVAMFEHSYYSVISPEGCASILWKDSSMKERAAEALKMHAEDLLHLGVVDAMIKEPLGGAHHEHQTAANNLKEYILSSLVNIKALTTDQMLEERYNRFRRLGEFQEL